MVFVVQVGAVLMRHRGHNGQYLPLKWDFVDAVTLCGHNGRCDTLWTLLPLNGVQEVGGLPEGTSMSRSFRPDQDSPFSSQIQLMRLLFLFSEIINIWIIPLV